MGGVREIEGKRERETVWAGERGRERGRRMEEFVRQRKGFEKG